MATGHAALAGLHILVVEDVTVVAMQIEEMLRELGCEIVGPVPDLDAALAAVQRDRLDGALLDINLKGQAATPVAAELAARGVPFILVTGYPRLAGDAPVMRLAPRVAKPFTRDQLAQAMMESFAPRG
jgi:CheY-like chemotaxis protein